MPICDPQCQHGECRAPNTENVVLPTSALVKSDGKERIVTLVYPCQVAITELVKMHWNVIVKMGGTVLTATFVSII